MEIFAVELNALSSGEYLSLLSLVPKEKQESIRRFKNKEDSFRSLLAEVLIRSVIARKKCQKNRDIHFKCSVYGKPYLPDIAMEFNLSHSGRWVVCAIDETPIGIDIEEMKPIDLAIAKRFFSNSEWVSLNGLPEKDKLPYFYDLWTLKESYIKNVGLGLSIPLHLISFSIDEQGILFENQHTNEIRKFKQYRVNGPYKLSVCSFTNNFPEHIDIIKTEDFILKSLALLSDSLG